MRALAVAVLLASPAGASEPGAWSAALLEQSRQADRPLLLLVNDASCGACAAAESTALANPSVAGRLARDFLWARADRLVRPDLADVFRLAVRGLGGGDGFPLVAAVTPDGQPYAGRAGLEALEPAAFARFATEAASGFRVARSGLDPRAAALLDSLRAAQTPSEPQRPLAGDVVEASTRSVVGWSELGRAEGPLPHVAIRFLLAEHQRARRKELLKLAATALDLRLARGIPASTSATEDAQRLETWARAFAASGNAAYQAKALQTAEGLLSARDAGGLWPESAGDARVVAQTNGLAIGALALSARVFGRAADREASARAAAALPTRLGAPATLARVEGGASGGAFLDDYAALLAGLLELHETTGDARWRVAAQSVAEAAIGRFLDPAAGGFFLTDGAHEPLPVRVKHAFDGVLPSANGTLARALPHLARVTGEPRYAELGRRTVEAFLGDLQRAPRGLLTLAEGAAEVLGPVRAAGGEGWTPASRETRGAVTLEAFAPATPVRAGATLEMTLGLSIAPGSFVVARNERARDLAGLGVSIPFEGARPVRPLYPEGQPRRVAWNAAPIAAYESSAAVTVRITLPKGAAPGERPLRMRVLFQACTESGCAKPESVTLEVPVRIEAAR